MLVLLGRGVLADGEVDTERRGEEVGIRHVAQVLALARGAAPDAFVDVVDIEAAAHVPHALIVPRPFGERRPREAQISQPVLARTLEDAAEESFDGVGAEAAVEQELLSVEVVHAQTAPPCRRGIPAPDLVLQFEVGDKARIAPADGNLHLVDGVARVMGRRNGVPVAARDIEQAVGRRCRDTEVVYQLLAYAHHVELLVVGLPAGDLLEVRRVVDIDERILGRNGGREEAAVLYADAVRGHGRAVHRAGGQRVGYGGTPQYDAVARQQVGILAVREVARRHAYGLALAVAAVDKAAVAAVGTQEPEVVGMHAVQPHLPRVGCYAVVAAARHPHVGLERRRVLHPAAAHRGIGQPLGQHRLADDVHERLVVGCAPQGDRRTYVVDTGHILTLQVVGFVVDEDGGTLGRVDHTSLAPVARDVAYVDAAVVVDTGRVAVHHAEIGLAAVVEGHVVVAVAAQRELVALVQRQRQGMALGIGRMHYIAAPPRIGGVVGLAADGVVVERQHADGIVHRGRRVARHADDLAHEVVDVGVEVAPLHAADSVAVVQRLERELNVARLLLDPHRSDRPVGVLQTVAATLVLGMLGVVVTFQRLVVERQQRRRTVGGAEVAPAVGTVPHAHDIAAAVDLDPEVIGAERPRTGFGRAAQQHGQHAGNDKYSHRFICFSVYPSTSLCRTRPQPHNARGLPMHGARLI